MSLAIVYSSLSDVPDRVVTRFMQNAAKATEDTNGCLIWPLSLTDAGYGAVRYKTAGVPRGIGAHRLAMLVKHGKIDDGLVVDHLCRNRACINTDHLRITTIGENVRAGLAGYANEPKTHCPQNHPYVDENIRYYTRPDGGITRICRLCAAAKSARYRAKRAGAPS